MSWISIEKMNGSGDSTNTITISPNLGEQRSKTIKISSTFKTVYLNVIQPSFEATRETITLDWLGTYGTEGAANPINVDVTNFSNFTLTYSHNNNNDCESVSVDNLNRLFRIDVFPNIEQSSREFEVYVVDDDTKTILHIVKIIQSGNPIGNNYIIYKDDGIVKKPNIEGFMYSTSYRRNIEITDEEDWTSWSNIYLFNETLTEIPSYAFYTSEGAIGAHITHIKFPPTITKIGDYAFRDGRLKVINFENIEEVGDYAFYSACSESMTVLNTEKIKNIGGRAFSANHFKTIILENVEVIQDYAFYESASNDRYFELGPNITTIGGQTFSRATEIKITALTPPTINRFTFYGVGYLGKLYVPQGSDYSSWLSTDNYYLGVYDWTSEIF